MGLCLSERDAQSFLSVRVRRERVAPGKKKKTTEKEKPSKIKRQSRSLNSVSQAAQPPTAQKSKEAEREALPSLFCFKS